MANTENTFSCSLTSWCWILSLEQQLRPARQQEESWQDLQTTFTKGLLRFHKELSWSQQDLLGPALSISTAGGLGSCCVGMKSQAAFRMRWPKAWHRSIVRITRGMDWISRLINVLWNASWQCWMLILSRRNLVFSRWKHWFQPGWDLPCTVPHSSFTI